MKKFLDQWLGHIWGTYWRAEWHHNNIDGYWQRIVYFKKCILCNKEELI